MAVDYEDAGTFGSEREAKDNTAYSLEQLAMMIEMFSS